MIKSILVPTDFSENALSALKYAYAIAQKFNCRIRIAHAYIAFHSGFQSEEANEQERLQAETEAKQGMESFLQALTVDQRTDITREFFKGDLISAVQHWNEEELMDLIVMGINGASESEQQSLGNNSIDAARSSSVPAIVVPLETENFKLDQIAFFTNYNDSDVNTLKKIDELFDSGQSDLRLIHIHESDDRPSDATLKMLQEWAALLSRKTGIDRLSWELVNGEESAVLVNEVAARNNTDLLVLNLTEKNFFERLFHKNLVKAVIHQSKTPVLLVKSYDLEERES